MGLPVKLIAISSAALLFGLITGCGEAGEDPVILIFDVDPSRIEPGESAQLSWSTTNATQVQIPPYYGFLPASGSVEVNPESSTTYVLYASNTDGVAVAYTDLTVVETSPPAIDTFLVEPNIIQQGQTAALRWSTTGAAVVDIEPGVGPVSSAGNREVSPVATTTYVITASNDAGSVDDQIELQVFPVNHPLILHFDVSPHIIREGMQATMTWTTSAATEVTIEPHVGSVDLDGSIQVSPSRTTLYTLYASNEIGQAVEHCSLTVNDAEMPFVSSFTVSPDLIQIGQSATLHWTVVGANEVSIAPEIGLTTISGSAQVMPAVTTSYELTAASPAGTVTESVTLSVVEHLPPEIDFFEVTPPIIELGQSAQILWGTTGADEVLILPDVGVVGTSGARLLSPEKTTTYILVATHGTATAEVSVTLEVTFRPEPEEITLSAGRLHALKYVSSYRVLTWGDNHYGQLGNGTFADQGLPVQVLNLTGVEQVSAGGFHGLALRSNGSILSWGDNSDGQLGTMTEFDQSHGYNSSIPVEVDLIENAVSIVSGNCHSLALLDTGAVMAWGDNYDGQLGIGQVVPQVYSPHAVVNIGPAAAIGSGLWHSLAVLAQDGRVFAWGSNYFGELGDGTQIHRSAPVQVVGIEGVISVDGGRKHSIALTSDGRVLAWGYNAYGQLGPGVSGDSSVPVEVEGIDGIVTKISAGIFHNLALLENGRVRAWGSNDSGQLGNSISGDSATPVPITDAGGTEITEVVDIAAGGRFNLLSLSDGTIMAWGENSDGQLGIGTTENQIYPVVVQLP